MLTEQQVFNFLLFIYLLVLLSEANKLKVFKHTDYYFFAKLFSSSLYCTDINDVTKQLFSGLEVNCYDL